MIQNNALFFVWIIFIVLLFFAAFQALLLLWLNRPAWMLRFDGPSDPVMPRVAGEARQSLAGAEAGQSSGPLVEGRMVVLSGVMSQDPIAFPSNHFGIGRFRNEAESIFVAFDERSVSRRHAVFHADGVGLYYLTDTHSSYGTFLRTGATFEFMQPGQRERIFNGDEVRFGQHVSVRFELPGDTRTSSTQL